MHYSARSLLSFNNLPEINPVNFSDFAKFLDIIRIGQLKNDLNFDIDHFHSQNPFLKTKRQISHTSAQFCHLAPGVMTV